MKKSVHRLVRLILGWVFIVLGLAGLVLPFLQGWLFLAIGAVLLAPTMPFFSRILARIENRFPHLRKVTARWKRPENRGVKTPPQEGKEEINS